MTNVSGKRSFLRKSWIAYIVVPIIFAAITIGALVLMGNALLSPYKEMVGWFFTKSEEIETNRDLYSQAIADAQNGTSVQGETQQTLNKQDITYPYPGDRYGEISIAGTTVSAPLYYGDDTATLNKGVGTFKDDVGAGIPGEGKTILLAGHNNTFFNGLQQVEVGDIVTIETHYGTYTYEVTEMEVKDYQDATAYDFSRTDENLIMYTCYPFDALGFTPDRYFVYAKYVSGPVLVDGEE